MTREIKFRAWDKENNYMIVDSLMSMSSIMRDYIGKRTDANGTRYDKNYLLMQYTGLHDKNGKEIYEGDIVQTSNGLRIVEYLAPSFCLCKPEHLSSKAQGNFGNYVADSDEFSTPLPFEKVIGNIWEHAQLIQHNNGVQQESKN